MGGERGGVRWGKRKKERVDMIKTQFSITKFSKKIWGNRPYWTLHNLDNHQWSLKTLILWGLFPQCQHMEDMFYWSEERLHIKLAVELGKRFVRVSHLVGFWKAWRDQREQQRLDTHGRVIASVKLLAKMKLQFQWKHQHIGDWPMGNHQGAMVDMEWSQPVLTAKLCILWMT